MPPRPLQPWKIPGKSLENGWKIPGKGWQVSSGNVQGCTCELGAEHLWVVQDVLPELLKLRDPRHVLQQAHQVPADHETIHELGKNHGERGKDEGKSQS